MAEKKSLDPHQAYANLIHQPKKKGISSWALAIFELLFSPMTLAPANKRKIIFVLGVLSAIGPLSIDMYLPAFKTMATALHCSQVEVGYTLSIFFFGICLGQLINGPMLDHFGRKKVLYAGLGLYVLSSLACAGSQAVGMLIVCRFFQALGASIGMVAPNAVVRETFEESDRPKVLSLLILILGVSPILAPSLGSLLLRILSWPFIFVVLGIIMAAMLFLIRAWLPEHPHFEKKSTLSLANIAKDYRRAFAEKRFFGFALAGASGAGSIFAFVNGAPLTFLNAYGLDDQRFGWVFAIIASGIISASQLNRFLLKNRSSLNLLSFVLPLQLSIGVLALILWSLGLLTLPVLMACLFCFLGCQGIVFPNMSTVALKPIAKGAGTASALMGSMQMATGALSSSLVGFFYEGSALAMLLVMSLCSLLANGLFVYSKRQYGN